MARIGRKRKHGQRHRSGDLARPAVDYRALAAQQPHRRILPEAQRLDQRAGTALGTLFLTGRISEQACEAGERYSVICGRYRAVIMAPRGQAPSGRGYLCGAETTCREDGATCECRRRKERYDAAFEALSRAGQRAAVAVARVAVQGETCPIGMLGPLQWGLAVLAEHFGLGARRLR
jgi:hypothetical protein